MKKGMFFALITLVFVMGSCSKKDQKGTTSQTSQTTLLPTKASTYVEINYPDATIDYVLVLANSSAKYLACNMDISANLFRRCVSGSINSDKALICPSLNRNSGLCVSPTAY